LAAFIDRKEIITS